MSTAALTHDSGGQVPPEAEPLKESGYFCIRTEAGFSHPKQWYLSLFHQDNPRDVLARLMVTPPREISWRAQITPATVSIGMQPGEFKPGVARAYAELMVKAAAKADEMNAPLAERIKRLAEERAKREQEREEERRRWREQEQARREAAIAARAAQLEAIKPMVEELQWRLGDQIRLRRDPKYRSTVFGTIDKVHADPENYNVRRLGPWMEITTERGKYMDIRLLDVSSLEIREEGQKRYTKLYERKDN